MFIGYFDQGPASGGSDTERGARLDRDFPTEIHMLLLAPAYAAQVLLQARLGSASTYPLLATTTSFPVRLCLQSIPTCLTFKNRALR